jgi:hypothetical protein
MVKIFVENDEVARRRAAMLSENMKNNK